MADLNPGASGVRVWRLTLIFAALLLFAAAEGRSSTFRDTFGWTSGQVRPMTIAGAGAVSAEGCALIAEEGGLMLPVMTVHYAVDPGMRVRSFKVLALEWARLGDGYSVDEWRRAAELWQYDDWIGPGPDAAEDHSGGGWYPPEAVEYAGGGYLRGRRVEGFVLRPVRYRGQGGELEYLSRLEIEVELEGDGDGGVVKVARAVRGIEDGIDRMVEGMTRLQVGMGYGEWMEGEGVKVEDGVGVEGGFVPSLQPEADGSPVEYVIVTSEELSGEFERLAEWKKSKGVGAVVRTVDWIEANYPNGVDLAETIRFFLQDAYANWGTVWVLLGGDTDVIPIRYAWSRYVGPNGEKLPTDVYYSCLDGDWNDDGDERWGEGRGYAQKGDLADLYPEVFVGRAPVNNVDEAAVFVDKVIGYEKNPPVGYQKKALLFAEVLFPDNWDHQTEPYLDGADLAESVAAILPSDFEITRLYENNTDPDYPGAEPLSMERVIEELNLGYGIAHHIGHGFRTTMSTGSGTLHNPEVASLTNGEKISVVCGLNCDGAAVDYGCIGETFVLNPNGGGVAYLGSTRFSFPEVAGGYQDEFYKLIFRHGVTRLGQALGWGRAILAPLAHNDNVSRWSQFVHILLGDPEMCLWTAVPSELSVSLPQGIRVGAGELNVTVRDAGTSLPVRYATVTCRKEGEVYAVGLTDESGIAEVEISPDTQGALAVTVTARDYLPYEESVPVSGAQGAYVYVQSLTLDDGAGGDGDGLPERGEVLDVRATLINGGTAASSEIAGVLAFEDEATLELLVDSIAVTGLGPGSSAEAPPFRVRVPPTVPDGRRVAGAAVFSTSQGGSRRDLVVRIAAPRIEIYSTTVDDVAGGDGDGVAEPGETVDVLVTLANAGSGSGASVYALLDAYDGDAQVGLDSLYYGAVEPGAAVSGGGFVVQMGTDPAPSFRLSIRDAGGTLDERDFDVIPPAAPGSLKGYGEEGSISLVWTPSSMQDNEGYLVYRSLVQGGPYTRVTPSPIRSSSSYEDRGLQPLTRYFYTVADQDSSGNESLPSQEISVSTNPPALPGWPQYLDIETAGGVTLGDLDGDGDLEVVAPGGEIYAYHHDGEEVLDGDAEVITHGVFSSVSGTPSKGFWCTPAVADMDGDGAAEIAANYWDGAMTYLWSGSDASVKPGWPMASSEFAWSSPSIGDIDGDGQWDIVTGGGEGKIYAWHIDGTEVADGDGDPSTDGVLVDHGSNYSYGSTAVVDLDGDGADEIMAALRDGDLLVVRGDGTSYPGFPYSTGKSIVSTPCAADVDGDGDLEIVLAVGSSTRSDNSALHVVDVRPSVQRQWKADIVFNQDFNSSPAIGDLDGDSILDIVVGSGDGKIYALRGADGSPLAGWPVETKGRIQGSAAIADINGDRYPDVLIGDEEGSLYCLDYKGESLPGFPIQLSGVIRSAPAVWDVNDDGLVDILCQAMDKTVYAWTYDGAFDPTTVGSPWPMFLHDPRNTSFFGTDMPFPARVASWELWPEDGGVVMSWRPAGWDGKGSWAVHRKDGESAGAAGGGRPALLSGYSDITRLGLFSAAGGAGAASAQVLTFIDPAAGGGKVSYVLELICDNGLRRYFGPRSIEIESGGAPGVPRLLSVSPNPFRVRAEFLMFIPEGDYTGSQRVTLRVFDAAGRAVSSQSWTGLGPGVHRLAWDGRNRSGAPAGSGVYFYSVEVGRTKQTGKIMLVR